MVVEWGNKYRIQAQTSKAQIQQHETLSLLMGGDFILNQWSVCQNSLVGKSTVTLYTWRKQTSTLGGHNKAAFVSAKLESC